MSKIIVGVDLSAESERAVAHAVAVARHVGWELLLVLVDAVPEPPEGAPESMRIIAERYTATLTARLDAHRRQLAALRERWLGHGIALSQLIVDGFADERLPAVATEVGAELIVVGSHGRSGLKRFLLGSVAEHVTRRAEQSVLVARGDAPDGGYRRVVIGTDFSAAAELALGRALPMIARGGHLHLVHCWTQPWVLIFGEPIGVLPADDELQAAIDRQLVEAAHRVRARLRQDRPDIELTSALVPALPAQGLVEAAAAHQADLVVVGSHGRRGVRRFVLGSVAEVTLRHAPCSVLVAR